MNNKEIGKGSLSFSAECICYPSTLLEKIQISCSAVTLSVRFKFLKLPTIVSLFNSRAMKQASDNYEFLRLIH